MNAPYLQFLGASGTVTGAKFLVDTGKTRFLVDCGMFQGAKKLRLLNWEAFPLSPSSVDHVLLTHAHIDHIGMLPKFVRDGFQGPAWATPVTVELAQLTLADSAHLQEEDAAYANKKGFSKHTPALPLYTLEDAGKAIDRLRPLEYGETLEFSGGTRACFRDAGHILGSGSVEAEIPLDGTRCRLLFSGDLGRYDTVLLEDPAPGSGADYIVVESTYGNRRHPREENFEEIGEIIRSTAKRGGAVLVPAFAVGRTQTLLYAIRDLKARNLIPDLPVYVDSPMAIAVTELFCRHIQDFDEEARAVFRRTGECPLIAPNLHFVRTPEESKKLNDIRFPCVIISASGMATGGRVLHHLKSLAPDPRNTLLLPGFQAPGTRGDSLARGARSIKIHGSYVDVAAEVVQLDVFSAHADQSDLLAWLAACERRPRRVFVTHGEGVPADTLRRLAWDRLKLHASVPEQGARVSLK
jgi:metallo-beta-lactamase family protein